MKSTVRQNTGAIRSMLRSILLRSFLVAAAASATWASTIRDPAMDVQEDVLSDPVSHGIRIVPTANGGGLFGFFNDTGQLITALRFDLQALPGLSQDTIGANFFCGGGRAAPNPFFLQCTIDYNSDNGHLTISFFGVNSPDDDEQVG